MKCITKKKIQNFWVNNGVSTAFVIIIVLANLAVIAERLWYYTAGPGGKYTDAIGWGVPIARSTAAGIKLDCGILLISVLRNFLSWVRGTWIGTYLPVDKNISFHKGLAWVILILGTIHTVAHFVNVESMASATEDEQAVLIQLGLLQAGQTPASPWKFAWTTIPGVTGVVVTLVMIVMFTTAVSSVRRPMFELFWFSHHLFIAFYLVLCGHGAAAILERAEFWMWNIGPMLFYAIERIIRMVRKSQKTIIIKAIQHPSKVIEIRMRKATFTYSPGHYVFLCCPYIADYEWHPFTISSSPDKDYMSCHIRIVGDWTGKLYKLLNPEGKIGVIQEDMLTSPNGKPILLVDGPFGTASEDVWKFDRVLLFAAGIGVTPFASILQSIKHKLETDSASCRIKHVEFYWSNRDHSCFEWFVDLLSDLEKTCPYLQIHLFFTGKLTAEQVRAYMHGANDEENPSGGDDPEEETATPKKTADALTGLSTSTIFGRWDVNGILAEKAQQLEGKTIGVFFCGPAIMSKLLLRACEKNTSIGTHTKFVYHKENF